MSESTVKPQVPPPIDIVEEIRRGRTFEALKYPEYRLLFISGLFIFLSVQAQMVIRGWLAADLTGTNTGLGGVFFGFAIPMLLLTPVAGVAADRFPKRAVLLVATTLLFGSALWIGLADAFGFLEYWMLIGASALQAAGFSIFGPARISFTSELVEHKDLQNAVVLSQISMNSTRIVGPAAAGGLIGVQAIGTAGSQLITAALMFIALCILLPLPKRKVVSLEPRRSPYAEFRDGLSYVRGNKPVLLLILVSYSVILFAFPYIAFLPILADEVFDVGSTGFGVMSAAQGFAAVVVSLYIARLVEANTWRIQAAAGTAFCGSVVLLGLAPSYELALVALAFAGGATAAFQAMNNTLILTESSMAYHGRVQSLLMLGFSGFGLAALPLGKLADAIGLQQTMVGMGSAGLACMVVYYVVRGRMLAGQAPDLG